MIAAFQALVRPNPAARPLLDNPIVLWGLVLAGIGGLYGQAAILDVVRTLRLPDTDDAMRLVQVRDLLAGQGWFDVAQHRLPPEGASMHWSRLVDLPIAALILLLRPLAGARAEAIAAALWPALAFGLYAVILYRGVRDLFGRRDALLAVFAATQTVLIGALFAPGRVDHHSLQICAVLGMALCLMRTRHGLREGLAAGALSALSLAIGLEALPFIAAAGLVAAGAWIVAGEPTRRLFAGFGLALGIGAPALFALQTAPGAWGATACDALSPPWLWLCAAGGLTGAASLLGARLSGPGRLALAAGGGALAVAGFVLIAPSCLAGPFPDMPDLVRREWLGRVHEMRPVWTLLREQPALLMGTFLPALVAAVAALVLAVADAERRRAWGLAGGFLCVGLAVAVLQFRGLYVTTAFVPLVAGPLLGRAVALLREPGTTTRRQGLALLAGLATLGKVWLILATLAVRADPEASGPSDGWSSCTAGPAMADLAALPPGTVLAPVDLGPSLLLNTPHRVVAAPYHRNIVGIQAGIEAFGSEESLRGVAAARGADYIVLCRAPGGRSPDGPVARGLLDGALVPSWLEPVPVQTMLPQTSGLRVWRVQPGR
ncbi:hypothetical protein [Methylobacterium oryzisoli]|uniref:hypothetical protein n=1 Tax=Methylobacterium oryzisoli TaxID=3385502 RepID=UPI003891CD66